MKLRNWVTICLSIVLLDLMLVGTSCSWNKAQRGGAIGAGAGAGVGAVLGSKSDNTIAGAIFGAAVGGAAGAAIGHYMDKQAQEMEKDLENAKIERIGEGIKITFDSGILFLTNSYNLEASVKDNLVELVTILNKYDDTNILVEGHTDNTGSDTYNQDLSEKRASTVSDFLKQNGIPGSRISKNGYGEKQPIIENESPEGRQKNRRVDIAIFANKKLKKAAEKGQLSVK